MDTFYGQIIGMGRTCWVGEAAGVGHFAHVSLHPRTGFHVRYLGGGRELPSVLNPPILRTSHYQPSVFNPPILRTNHSLLGAVRTSAPKRA